MATIIERGPHQFLVQIRRKGVKVRARTFETRAEAKDWADIMEGKVVGGEHVGPTLANTTTFADALDWYERVIIPRTPRSAKNKRVYVKYWKDTRFAQWKMSALMPWDLVDWRVEVLDEDSAEDDSGVGPDAKWGRQTCWHHLQLISHLYGEWALAHRTKVESPITRGVRPTLDDGRERRLDDIPDADGHTEEARLYTAVDGSNSKWLGAATRIAIETAMRQAELSGLVWDRVRLDVEFPHLDLLKTKNDRPRRIPLNERAIAAFKTLGEAKKGKPVLGIETPRAIGHAFRAVVNEENFPDLRWHDLRHEAISRLFEKTDFRDHEIMAVTGHLTPTMLARYAHLRSHKLGARMR